MTGSAPSLSIVIAAWPDATGLVECLEALAPQRDEAVEVLVVGPGACPQDLESRFPWARGVETAANRLIPHLWGLGIEQARGSVVATTTAHFVPALDWVAAIRSAHTRLKSPAVGGRIDPPRGRGLVNWATYFLRYSGYLGYGREQAVPDLAADNASYDRAEVLAHAEFLRDGFWEQELHRRLLAEGKVLVFAPDIRVRQRTSFGFGRFLCQRFAHGRQFGQARLRGRGWLARAALVAASPLLPLVFLGKITGRVVRSRRDFGPFLLALPVLSCFLLAWSLGEASGYLFKRMKAEG